VNWAAPVILIEIETDQGVTGIAESVASPTVEPVHAIIRDAIPHFVGKSVYDGNRTIADYYRSGFNARGTGSAPRYFSQAMAGIELALWDAIGKAAGQPLHRLLGGAVRDEIRYFGFVQGDTPKELAEHARTLVEEGFQVLYVKVGRGEALDLEIVQAVRKAIGNVRLRLDANEVWDGMEARRMFEKLKPHDPEFIEQPVPGPGGAEILARLRALTGIPIAADQSVYGPEEAYDICRSRAADVIVLGLHETCGVLRFRKAAAIAEAAGVRICLHGVFETGITTCAANQVAATIPNLDDGNQIMWQLLEEDIVASPSLTPVNGALPVFDKPGLGFELDRDAVGRAAEAYRKQQ
ncbi:MAG TPA: mandelate racemase/muconate lactonizing enzyme family protein, partial [Dongiaceae bacterium]|nr:mandelate racemase/muconate lactonizing enzyme family protein [Dongiaceae bacterium]